MVGLCLFYVRLCWIQYCNTSNNMFYVFFYYVRFCGIQYYNTSNNMLSVFFYYVRLCWIQYCNTSNNMLSVFSIMLDYAEFNIATLVTIFYLYFTIFFTGSGILNQIKQSLQSIQRYFQNERKNLWFLFLNLFVFIDTFSCKTIYLIKHSSEDHSWRKFILDLLNC